jgi:hypothetical protein
MSSLLTMNPDFHINHLPGLYCAARSYGRYGLEEHGQAVYGEIPSIRDSLGDSGHRWKVFLKLPESEEWLPWFIKTSLVSNRNNVIGRFCLVTVSQCCYSRSNDM